MHATSTSICTATGIFPVARWGGVHTAAQWCCGEYICWCGVLFGSSDNVLDMAMAWVTDDSSDVMDGSDLMFGSWRSWWCLMIAMVENVKYVRGRRIGKHIEVLKKNNKNMILLYKFPLYSCIFV